MNNEPSTKNEEQKNMHSIIHWLNRMTMALGALVLAGMVALGCANMVLRSLGHPVTGTFELMGFGGALIAALALGGTQEAKGHIQVNVLDGILPRWARHLLEGSAHLVSTLFFGLVAWRLFVLTRSLKASGELSETLHMAYYPLVLVVGAGFVCLVINLVLQCVHELQHLTRPRGELR